MYPQNYPFWVNKDRQYTANPSKYVLLYDKLHYLYIEISFSLIEALSGKLVSIIQAMVNTAAILDAMLDFYRLVATLQCQLVIPRHGPYNKTTRCCPLIWYQ